MRRTATFLCSCFALGVASLAPSSAGATYAQCPAVDKDSGCQFLITVTSNGVQVGEDTAQGPYEGSHDALIGVQNDSSNAISAFMVSAEGDLFGLERDGLCDPGERPAPGCVVLPQDSEGNMTKGINPATGTSACGPHDGACGFPAPGGEPTGVTFVTGVEVTGFAANGDAVSGFEGPTSWFTNISSQLSSGIVHFSPELAAGGSSYFALRLPPSAGLKIGNATSLSSALSGGGQSGPSISVAQGTAVSDVAIVGGVAAGVAAGEVSYAVYSDAACNQAVTQAGSAGVAAGVAGASAAETGLLPGKYYWQAHYGGDINNQSVSSPCGSDVLTVLAPTTLMTTQSGGGVSGASLTVQAGTPVVDRARITGPLAASASGSVTYTLFKDRKCTVPVAGARTVGALNGVGVSSSAIKPKVGTYYWKASYSGDAVNAPSVSACGSEILRVALKANLGLPASNVCLSRRGFVAHPHAPRNVKLVSVEVQINGNTVKRGKRQPTLSLAGLPKGAFKVALIAKSSTGKLYEDIRTFHTCASARHHKR